MLSNIGKWKIIALETGDFRLDGGAMMGSVPKVLWEKTNPADKLNRIDLSLRCLFLDDGKDKVNMVNWAMLEHPTHLRTNNLPQKLKDDLLPKYEGWPDIQEALRMPADDIDIQDTFDYLLKADEYYTGTRWELHLFDVFPELEEYYIKPENR